MKQLNVRVDEGLHRAVKVAAVRRGVSVSLFVEDALRLALEDGAPVVAAEVEDEPDEAEPAPGLEPEPEPEPESDEGGVGCPESPSGSHRLVPLSTPGLYGCGVCGVKGLRK